MPLSGSAFWAVILSSEKTNIHENPSFERGTAGWGTLQAGTIGTTSAFQQFGAWSGSVAPTGNGTSGAIGPTFTAGAGTDYTFSAYVRGQSGVAYRLSVGDSNGQNFVGSALFTGGGTWHRYAGSWTEGAGATRRMVISKNSDGDTHAFYVDGAQIEVGSLTTYLDGDQEGCYWLGLPHQSQSVRSGTFRGGGSVVALADLGLKPDDALGAGMPPLETLSQSFALDAGGEFLDQRASERPFVLTCKPVVGTTLGDYHRVRRGLITALKADGVTPKSPVRLWYTGGQGTVQIDAVLASGFEGGEMNGPMAENLAVRFIAHDPYWYATTQQGTAFVGRGTLGSTNFMARRDQYGRWGTLGANGSTLQGVANAVAADASGVVDAVYTNGTIILCGSFGTVAGTSYNDIAMYYEALNTFGTLQGGTLGTNTGRPTRALALTPWGSLLIGGDFIKAGGTLAVGLAQWNPNGFGTWIGGTIDVSLGTSVRAFAQRGGTTFLGGRFGVTAGSNSGSVMLWCNNAFGTLDTGLAGGGFVRDMVMGKDDALYITGETASVGGTTVNNVARWNGAWGSMGTGVYGGGDTGVSIESMPNGQIVVGGAFSNTDSGAVSNIALWNGVAFSKMGSGLFTASNPTNTWVGALTADPQTGDLYAGGRFGVAGDIILPDGFAHWNGYAWLPMDVDLGGVGTVNVILLTPQRTLYAMGSFSGTASAAQVVQVVNSGMADAYPTIKIRALTQTGRIYQIVNTFPANAGIYFDYALQLGEEVTLETAPGNRSFTSSYFGDIFSAIVPGSNLSTFKIAPGTNWLSFFSDSFTTTAAVYWNARSDSIDGGTAF